MKQIAYLIVLALVMVACGTDSHHFKMNGHLLHLNQGEFLVYSPDGVIDGIDTIKVEGGRFTYEIPCQKEGTLLIVFPNFTEQPVFAAPGKTISIDGDASHLKQIQTEGSDDNELMNKFREQIASASPPEMAKAAEQFIADHPKSIVGAYLLNKYFLQIDAPDYAKVRSLLELMIKNQPSSAALMHLKQQIARVNSLRTGSPMPSFSVTDINGKAVSQAHLAGSGIGVVMVWASWSFESTSYLSQMKELKQKYGNRLQLLSVCVDASRRDCREVLRRDSIPWPTICDEQMFDSQLIQKLGLTAVPDNIVLKNGRIVAHSLPLTDLKKKVESLM